MKNNLPIKEEEFDFSGLISSIKRRKKSFFLIAFSIFLLSGIYAFKKKPLWEGTFQIVLKQTKKTDSLASLINSGSPISLLRNASSANKLNTEILILQSPSVLKPIYDYVKSEYNLLGYETSKLRFREWKKNNLLVKLEKKSNVLKISYFDKEKDLIIPVLNKISSKYQDYSGRDTLKTLTNAKNYLDKQVLIYTEKTSSSSNDLQAYANLHNIEVFSSGIGRNLKGSSSKKILPNTTANKGMLNFENTYIRAKNQVNLINEQLKTLENIDEKTNLEKKIGIYTSLIDPTRTIEILAKIQEIDSELARYKSAFKSEYPKVKYLEQLKKETFLQLKDLVIGSLEGQKKSAIALQNASKRPQEVIAKYKELFRIYNLNFETLSNLELERKINALSLAKKNDPWELISNPLIYDKAVAPNKPRIIFIGIFFGLILASLYVRLKDKNSEFIYEKKYIDNFLGYKNLFDFSNIDENKLEVIINNLISQYFSKEKSILFPIGEFYNERPKNVLKLMKENKNIIKVVNNIKDIDKDSKILILISTNNLSKKELSYMKEFFNIRKDLEISTAYI